jgi:formylglycine-generating enzyme required for sulfatase activity
MERAEKVWPLLKHSPDSRVRSYLIHRLRPLGADVEALVKRLAEEPDVTIQRALVLSLGEFSGKELSPGERNSVVERLQEMVRTAADPGLHGAAEWMLRQWEQGPWLKQMDEEWAKDKRQREQKLECIRHGLAKEKGAAKPQWYVNGEGQTMVILPGPIEFLMGSPSTEAGRFDDEQLHRRRIGRTFAIAAKPVTVEQFRRLLKGYPYHRQYAPTVDCPMPNLRWYGAAMYCNLLSKEEGLPEKEWCYQPNKDGQYEDGMKLAPNYLQRTGYRLPTEAEWEYACRAGAVTSRSYGDSEQLLGKYGCHMATSGSRGWPVASLKPNDWGLFDMHGNVMNWCQDRQDPRPYPRGNSGQVIEDNEGIVTVSDNEPRVLRGGSFYHHATRVRCANRCYDAPSNNVGETPVGFRVAKTFR